MQEQLIHQVVVEAQIQVGVVKEVLYDSNMMKLGMDMRAQVVVVE